MALVAAVLLVLVGGLAACGTDASSDGAAATTVTTTQTGLRGSRIEPPSPKPEFTLTDTAGQPYDFAAETAGKLTYLYFGYTNCPDICQIRMSQLTAVLARPNVPTATVVFVTSDPERDTGPVLRQWLAHFNPTFVGLTGTPAEVAAAQEAAGVPVARKQPTGTPGEYLMDHPSSMLAFAPDGKGYTEYPYGTKIQEYVHDARILIKRT